jgi:hypothetical protein
MVENLTIHEPAREIDVVHRTDGLVVGVQALPPPFSIGE